MQPLNPVFFTLSSDQSFEIFPKHNEYARISESFALNLIISVPLQINSYLPILMQTFTKFCIFLS